MRRRIAALALLRIVSLLILSIGTGCASFRSVDPASGTIELGENEGLVLIHVDTDVAIKRLRASGVRVGGPFGRGTHLWVMAAPIGRYEYDEIMLDFTGWIVWWKPGDGQDELGFEVVANQVSYPGLLRFESQHEFGHVLGGWFRLRMLNRSAMLLDELGDEYAELFARYPLRYTGRGVDDYFQLLETARERTETAASDEAVAP